MPRKKQAPKVCDLEFSLDDTVFMMWNTNYVGFELANVLNKLYDFNLARTIDLEIESAELGTHVLCPLYEYYDSDAQLAFLLLNNPLPQGGIAPSLNTYDNLLLINGRDAREFLERISDDFIKVPQPPSPDDVLAMRHYQLVQEVMQDVVEAVWFDLGETPAYSVSELPYSAPIDSRKYKELSGDLQFVLSVAEMALGEIWGDDI